MKSFPTHTKFKYQWRNYQQIVLNKLDAFLNDKHLHVVAPPGSGKTILGLEVAIRLNKPTLILAPTLTIRDQWISRLCELFLDTTIIPSWVSTNIKDPNFLTVITYQGLHAACSEDNANKVVKRLNSIGIETLVLDEAHHLKNQWWITLNEVKKTLAPTVIGLTATPPYDANYGEWLRYLEINGEIDIEMSIPELIIEGDLCPHQDFVYFSQPTPEEFQRIYKYREDGMSVYNEYSKSELLISSFMETDIWKNPENHLEWIYENPKIYTSYLILLLHNTVKIPQIHFDVLGLNKSETKREKPDLLYDSLEIILNFFLFQDRKFFMDYESEKESIINKLRHRGVIERSVVNLSYNSNLNRLLVSSNGKLNSIVDIARFEYTSLKEQLRMVILSDFIRDEYLAFSDSEKKEIKKMGVVPIFEHLLDNSIGTKKIGILTGSLVIVPKTSLDRLQTLCEEKGLSGIIASCKEYREEHILIESNAAIKDYIVELTTQLFTEGEIKVLVGTKALLGEGWDAPAINSLILASFVGSFVLSNQMRGRAIRVQRDNPTKTSNIWHLVCIDPTEYNGGQDLNILSRRFKSFVGISNTPDIYIANGLSRLDVVKEEYTYKVVNKLNHHTLKIADERESLSTRWKEAINSGNELIDEIKIPYRFHEKPYEKVKRMYFAKTIGYLIADLLMLCTIYGFEVLEMFIKDLRFMKSFKDMLYYLVYAGALGLIFFGIQTFRTLNLYIRYRDIAKDIQSIGEALLKALIKQGAIKTAEKDLFIYSKKHSNGAVSCYLGGGTSGEQSIFLDALQEIVDTIDNPRYIMVRKGGFWKVRKDDFHAVPTLLGANENLASYFYDTWNTLVGSSILIYTRTLDGRKLLLKARIQSLSAKLSDDKPERYRKWG